MAQTSLQTTHDQFRTHQIHPQQQLPVCVILRRQLEFLKYLFQRNPRYSSRWQYHLQQLLLSSTIVSSVTALSLHRICHTLPILLCQSGHDSIDPVTYPQSHLLLRFHHLPQRRKRNQLSIDNNDYTLHLPSQHTKCLYWRYHPIQQLHPC